MVEMVENTLRGNALSDEFTKETIEKALKRVRKLYQQDKYRESEGILRKALSRSPDHPELLKELNRSLWRG